MREIVQEHVKTHLHRGQTLTDVFTVVLFVIKVFHISVEQM